MSRGFKPVLVAAAVAVVACSPFHVAYRVDSEPSGVDVYTTDGRHLGKTPIVVTESGESRTMIGRPSDCVRGRRTFAFRQRCPELATSIQSITIPRTCSGYDSPAIAVEHLEHSFVVELPAALSGPCPPPAPRRPLKPASLQPPSIVGAPWLPVAPASIPDPDPVPVPSRVGRIMLIAGLSAFAVAWSIPSLVELGAAVNPDDSLLDGQLAIPVYGPAAKGIGCFREVERCRDRSTGLLCEVDYIPGVLLLLDAVAQLAGLGVAAAGAIVYGGGSDADRARGRVRSLNPRPLTGPSMGWRLRF